MTNSKLCYGNSPELGGEKKKALFFFRSLGSLGERLTDKEIILALGKEANKRKRQKSKNPFKNG